MSTNSHDAVVVGAGIVGAACARELAMGGLRVAVCESSGIIGGGATAAGMGHLAVMDDSEAQFALTSYSQALWRELAQELPADAEYLPCGSLWIATDEEEAAEVRRKHVYYSARGLPVEILDGLQVAEAEPHLRPDLTCGLRMPSDSVCYPPCAARFLLQTVRERGGTTLLGKTALAVSDDGVEFADGSALTAEVIVLANGAAIRDLLPELPVQPRKGHLLITDRYPGFLRHQLIELGYLKSAHASEADSVAFNAQPRSTGQILIGSSRQFGAEGRASEPAMLSTMLSRAVEYLPELRNMSALRCWTGFRAATPDHLPLIGRYEPYRRVFLATGHEGLGISTSLATARILADEILRRDSEIPREPYRPNRCFGHA